MPYYLQRRFQYSGSAPFGQFFGVWDNSLQFDALRIYCPVGYNNAGGPFDGAPDGNSRHFTIKIWLGEAEQDGYLGTNADIIVPERIPDFSFGMNQTGDNPYTQIFFQRQNMRALIGVFDAVGYAPPFATIVQFQAVPSLGV